MTLDIDITIDSRNLDCAPKDCRSFDPRHEEKMYQLLNGQISDSNLRVLNFEADKSDIFISPLHIMCMAIFVRDKSTGLYSFFHTFPNQLEYDEDVLNLPLNGEYFIFTQQSNYFLNNRQ